MTDKAVDEFARTPLKGLPQHLADGQAGVDPIYMNPNTPQPKGLLQPGNIDLSKLPPVQNSQDPSKWSTVNSYSSIDEDPKSSTYGKEVLLRGYVGDKTVDPEHDKPAERAMWDQYHKSGKHLGVFDNGDDANPYSQQLHLDWEAGKIPGLQMSGGRQGLPTAQWAPPPAAPHIDMQTIPSSTAYRARAATPVQPPLKRRVYGQ